MSVGQSTDTLWLFRARCGHSWIGAIEGSYACPVCGLHEGDHHLIATHELPVQVDDYGCRWSDLAAKAEIIFDRIKIDDSKPRKRLA